MNQNSFETKDVKKILLKSKCKRARGEAKKTKPIKVLPKTADEISNGGLYAQVVRCGKANCKCASGGSEAAHTAFYFFTRRNGKFLKIYVRKSEINAFALITKQSAFERRQRRQAVKSSRELLRTFRADLSKYNGILKTLKAG